MAAFCSNCGAQLSDTAKFCVSCGAQTAPPAQPRPVLAQQQPVQQPQPHTQQQVQQPQYQYQQPYAVPIKKKSKLPVILSVAGVAVAVMAVTVILIIGTVSGILKKTADLDFYEIADNEVPSVKYILGEKRTVTGLSTSVRTDGTKEQAITYKSETDENTREDMLEYATELCKNYGFFALNDNNFSGPTGKDFKFGKESVNKGNLVVVQIDYDKKGYTITLLHGEGTITYPEGYDSSDQGNSTDVAANADPWVGLWRYEGYDGVELFNLKADGTFKIEGYYTDGSENVVMTGKYGMSDGNMKMTGLIVNGEPYDDLAFAFELSGDTATIGESIYIRVPEKDVAAVLSDPTAAYIPGGS